MRNMEDVGREAKTKLTFPPFTFTTGLGNVSATYLMNSFERVLHCNLSTTLLLFISQEGKAGPPGWMDKRMAVLQVPRRGIVRVPARRPSGGLQLPISLSAFTVSG